MIWLMLLHRTKHPYSLTHDGVDSWEKLLRLDSVLHSATRALALSLATYCLHHCADAQNTMR